MFQFWTNLEALASLSGWIQVVAVLSAAATTVFVFLLWSNGNRMISFLIDRERHASNRIKAVEKAAEQIRRELLETQQNQDIADQKRRLAEMDAGALRKEMEKIRSRYSMAEGALKDRIDELKDMNITQTSGSSGLGHITTRELQSTLDSQQRKMLISLLKSGPKGELDLIAVLDDSDSNSLALDFKKIFDEQGWTTQGIVQSAFSSPPKGLSLVIHSKQTAPSYAKFLQRTFTTLGLPVTVQINNKFREWSISLIVGQVS